MSEKERKSYSIKKRALLRWLYSHKFTFRDLSNCLHIPIKELRNRLDSWEEFNEPEMSRLIHFMGARSAFYVIYFPTFKDRKRVYYETFGRDRKYRGKRRKYERTKTANH